MKLEGIDEFAAAAGKAIRGLETFGKRAEAAGKTMMKIGLNLMAAGLLLGAGWILLLLIF